MFGSGSGPQLWGGIGNILQTVAARGSEGVEGSIQLNHYITSAPAPSHCRSNLKAVLIEFVTSSGAKFQKMNETKLLQHQQPRYI